ASVKGRGWICQKIACSRSGTTYQSAGLLIYFLDREPTSWFVVALPFKMTVGSTAMLRSVRAAFLRRTCLSRLERMSLMRFHICQFGIRTDLRRLRRGQSEYLLIAGLASIRW